MCNMAFVGRNEKNGAGIQVSYVAMETTAQRELERERERMRERERDVCKDGQIFLLGNMQEDDVFFRNVS